MIVADIHLEAPVVPSGPQNEMRRPGPWIPADVRQ
jgi:hypothetical protein